jgi:hypothetical protein
MNSLDLDIKMEKRPGKLVLVSDSEGLEILIENRREEYLGGRTKSFVEFGTTSKKEKIFWLPEDKHMLTIQKDDQTFTTYQVEIKSDSTARVIIAYDKDKNVIKITQ